MGGVIGIASGRRSERCEVTRPPEFRVRRVDGRNSKSDSTTPLPERLYGALNSGVTCDNCAATELSVFGWSGGP